MPVIRGQLGHSSLAVTATPRTRTYACPLWSANDSTQSDSACNSPGPMALLLGSGRHSERVVTRRSSMHVVIYVTLGSCSRV